MNPSKAEFDAIRRDIRAHCIDCCDGGRSAAAECVSKSCKLWKWRRLPEQLDLFNDTLKKDWIESGVKFAESFFNGSPVWWNDFIETYKQDNPSAVIHPNWTGSLASVMRKRGFVRLDVSRASKHRKNNGSREFAWQKKFA